MGFKVQTFIGQLVGQWHARCFWSGHRIQGASEPHQKSSLTESDILPFQSALAHDYTNKIANVNAEVIIWLAGSFACDVFIAVTMVTLVLFSTFPSSQTF